MFGAVYPLPTLEQVSRLSGPPPYRYALTGFTHSRRKNRKENWKSVSDSTRSLRWFVPGPACTRRANATQDGAQTRTEWHMSGCSTPGLPRKRIGVGDRAPTLGECANLKTYIFGGHRWVAKCPAHKDRSASLSIREGRDGRILLHCFAGCATADVLASAVLTLRDLFAGPPPSPSQLVVMARQRQEREAQKQAERLAARSIVNRLRQLDMLTFEWATRLDLVPDRPDGNALAALMHSCCEQIRNNENRLAELSQ